MFYSTDSPQPKYIQFTIMWQRKASNPDIWEAASSKCLLFCLENDQIHSSIIKKWWTYQNAVKSRRGPSSLHVPQDCHSRVEAQAFDNKLGGYNAQVLANIVATYFAISLMVNNTYWTNGS